MSGTATVIERSVKAEWLAAACETWPQELCQQYGFTYDCWHDEGDERVIELLGPDSPGEYVIRFHKSRLTDEHLQELVHDIVRDITRMGEEYTSGQHLVPGREEEDPRSGRRAGLPR